jgi:hypothetical protein
MSTKNLYSTLRETFPVKILAHFFTSLPGLSSKTPPRYFMKLSVRFAGRTPIRINFHPEIHFPYHTFILPSPKVWKIGIHPLTLPSPRGERENFLK